MAGQNFERREVLRVLSLASGLSSFSGFRLWAFGDSGEGHSHAQSDLKQTRQGPYIPQVFTKPEYQMIERLTEIIIPSDGSPGAREAGVAEFVDFLASTDDDVYHSLRFGLRWLDLYAQRRSGQSFLALSEDQQIGLLEPLAYKAKFRAGEEEGQALFSEIRNHTIAGFYTSRIGMQELDAPGLKLFYKDVTPCPHGNDPEHRRLQDS